MRGRFSALPATPDELILPDDTADLHRIVHHRLADFGSTRCRGGERAEVASQGIQYRTRLRDRPEPRSSPAPMEASATTKIESGAGTQVPAAWGGNGGKKPEAADCVVGNTRPPRGLHMTDPRANLENRTPIPG